MNRAMLQGHLAQAESHVAKGDQHLARQQELIAKLKRHGRDTADAEGLLKLFEELQVVHVADRDRLLRELGDSN